MNAVRQNAYGSALSPVKDARSAEAAILARITGRMTTAANRGSSGFPELAAAVADNRRFWAAAAADLAGEGNGLPQGLRVGLISISGFVARQTSRVLAGEAALAPLLDINRAIILGLSGEGSSA